MTRRHDADRRATADVLAGLIHRADLDGLVRLVDDCCATRDWALLRRLRDDARHAVGTGRQLWPAATLAEYRLALLAPADVGGRRPRRGLRALLDRPVDRGRRPAPHVGRAGAAAGGRATGRVRRPRAGAARRGDRGASTAGLPDVLDLPVRRSPRGSPRTAWRPTTTTAASSPRPTCRPRLADVELPADAARARRRRRRRPRRCASSSSRGRRRRTAGPRSSPSMATPPGRCARSALPTARWAPLDAAEAVAWLAWAGASGGAHGRRRGAAAGPVRRAVAGRRAARRPRRLAAAARRAGRAGRASCAGGGGTPTSR